MSSGFRHRLVSRRAVCRRGDAAFSVIELLTVIAVIVLLAGIAIGSLQSARQRAAIARSRGELALLAHALEEFKAVYGDYPETGPSAVNSQRVTGTSGPGLASAQAVLFNALTGVYGPAGANGGRLNGPALIDISKFTLENQSTINTATFGVPTGSPPAKQAVNTALLDPWGNRYLYYYMRPNAAAASWQAPSYLLYSAGPDGAATTQPDTAGIFNGTTQTAGDNADNLYANP
jgi:type II secretory pathway pseudopilin PulG